MTEKQLKTAFNTFKKSADAILSRIGKERDALRRLVNEYEDTLGEIDGAVEEIERGIEYLSSRI